MRKLVVLLGVAAALLQSPVAQTVEDFFIFPQVADGRLPNGQTYTSTLMVQSWLAASPTTCALRLYGMTATFGSAGPGDTFDITIPRDGWFQVKSSGTQAAQQGYATLTCSQNVYANLLYTLSANETKLSEATVFGQVPDSSFKLIADQTGGARLGLAVANNTDLLKTYEVTLRNPDGSTEGTGTFQVQPRRSLARFLDELIPASSGQVLEVRIRSTGTSGIVGLRVTDGTLLTTIPTN